VFFNMAPTNRTYPGSRDQSFKDHKALPPKATNKSFPSTLLLNTAFQPCISTRLAIVFWYYPRGVVRPNSLFHRGPRDLAFDDTRDKIMRISDVSSWLKNNRSGGSSLVLWRVVVPNSRSQFRGSRFPCHGMRFAFPGFIQFMPLYCPLTLEIIRNSHINQDDG